MPSQKTQSCPGFRIPSSAALGTFIQHLNQWGRRWVAPGLCEPWTDGSPWLSCIQLTPFSKLCRPPQTKTPSIDPAPLSSLTWRVPACSGWKLPWLCFPCTSVFMATAPGNMRLAIKIIDWRDVDKAPLIANSKLKVRTPPFFPSREQ